MLLYNEILLHCIPLNKSCHMQHISLNTTQNLCIPGDTNSESPLNGEKRFDFVLVFKEEEGSE